MARRIVCVNTQCHTAGLERSRALIERISHYERIQDAIEQITSWIERSRGCIEHINGFIEPPSLSRPPPFEVTSTPHLLNKQKNTCTAIKMAMQVFTYSINPYQQSYSEP